MRRLFFLFIVLIVAVGCDEMIEGEGRVTTRDYTLKEFNKIVFDMPGNLILSQGAQSIQITTNENIYEWLNVYVGSGILHIELRENIDVWNFDEMLFEVSVPYINAIYLDGSGDISIEDSMIMDSDIKIEIGGSGDAVISKLHADNVELNIEGSGSIRCKTLVSKSVKSEIEGSGNVTLCGSVPRQVVEIGGSGNVNSYDLTSVEADVEIEGSGDCHIHVLESLRIEIEGSGSVFYMGDPETDINIDGSGTVNRVF